MTTLRRAAKQAFVDMACMRDMVAHPDSLQFIENAMAALRTALSEPEQEPVAWNSGVPPLHPEIRDGETICVEYVDATPPQRKPLTDEEIVDLWADVSIDYDDQINIIEMARAIERAHGIGGEA